MREEIREEIDARVTERLSSVAASLRKSAAEHGPVVAKALNLTADALESTPAAVEGNKETSKDVPEKTVADEGQPGGD